MLNPIKIIWILLSIETHRKQNDDYCMRLLACEQETHLSQVTPRPSARNHTWAKSVDEQTFPMLCRGTGWGKVNRILAQNK
jgi:hypothetical protein